LGESIRAVSGELTTQEYDISQLKDRFILLQNRNAVMRAQHEEARLRSAEQNQEIKEEPDQQPDTIEKESQPRQFIDETAQIDEEPVED